MVDWTEIRDEEDAARRCRGHPGRAALLHGAYLDQRRDRFLDGALSPRRSGRPPGASSTSRATARTIQDAPLLTRDQAIASGVTINGLAIVNDRPNRAIPHTQPPGGLPLYYQQT